MAGQELPSRGRRRGRSVVFACGAVLALLIAGAVVRWQDVLLLRYELALRGSDDELARAMLAPEGSLRRRAARRVLRRRIARGRGGEFVWSRLGGHRRFDRSYRSMHGVLCVATGRTAAGQSWAYVHDRHGESTFEGGFRGDAPDLTTRILEDLKGMSVSLGGDDVVPELVGCVLDRRAASRVRPLPRDLGGVGMPPGSVCIWLDARRWERAAGTRAVTAELLADATIWERLRKELFESGTDIDGAVVDAEDQLTSG